MPDETTRYYTRYLAQVTGPYPRSMIGRMAQSRRLTRGHEVSADRQHWIPLEEFLVQDLSSKKATSQTASGPTYRATYRMEKIEERFASQASVSRKRSMDGDGFHVSPKIWLVGGGLFLLAIGGLVIYMTSGGSTNNASNNNSNQPQYVASPSSPVVNSNLSASSIDTNAAPAYAGAAEVARAATSASRTVQQAGGNSRSKATSIYTGSVVVSGVHTPVWLKLVRRGNTASAYYSQNGQQWTQVGLPEPIAFGRSRILAGMAVCAHNDTSLNTSRFSHVAMSHTQSSWSDANIGYPGKLGSARESNGTWTVTGGGSDVWDKHDQFNLFTRKVHGNTVITARVDSLTNTDPWAKAGVMLRGSTSDTSPFAYIFVTPHIGLAFQWRPHNSAK